MADGVTVTRIPNYCNIYCPTCFSPNINSFMNSVLYWIEWVMYFKAIFISITWNIPDLQYILKKNPKHLIFRNWFISLHLKLSQSSTTQFSTSGFFCAVNNPTANATQFNPIVLAWCCTCTWDLQPKQRLRCSSVATKPLCNYWKKLSHIQQSPILMETNKILLLGERDCC